MSWLWVEAQATQIRMALMAAQALDTNKTTGLGPGCGRTIVPDNTLQQQLGLDAFIAPGGSAGYSVQQSPCRSMALGHHHGPLTPAWPSMVT